MKRIFGTDGIRGIAYKDPITTEMCKKVGYALVELLGNPKIAIGRDTRQSGIEFEKALIEGIHTAGGSVLSIGILPTPAIAHLTEKYADAGIMISASHNPSEYNGFKFFSKKGYKFSDEEEEQIEHLIEQATEQEIIEKNAEFLENAEEEYKNYAKKSVGNLHLESIKIVIDSANGAAHSIVGKIFKELGAEIIEVGNNPNGININKECGSMHPKKIQEKVIEKQADIGIALDGDADRLILCDEKGELLDGDKILAISAIDLNRKGKLSKNTVVATVMTNMGFDEAMKKEGITVIRTKVGDTNVIEEMKKNDLSLGGEQSGHIIFKEYSVTGDGILAALQILRIMKEQNASLSELAECFDPYPQISINVPVRKKKEIESLKAYKEIKKARKSLDNGRVLVRYSGTENVLRVMIEGPDKNEIKRYAENIAFSAKEEIGCD